MDHRYSPGGVVGHSADGVIAPDYVLRDSGPVCYLTSEQVSRYGTKFLEELNKIATKEPEAL